MNDFGSAIILAGGKSRRMGFDKQKVCIGGSLMVNYIARQLEGLFEQIIIVTNTPEVYCPSKYLIVEDRVKNKGPMGGIQAGLSYGNSNYCYVTAGDMPFINIKYIRMMQTQILQENKRREKEVYSCVTKIKGHTEPFNGFYHKSCLTDLKECIKLDHLKITRLLEERNSLLLAEAEALKFSPDLDMFLNLNTIDKLKNCKKLKGRITISA